MYYQVVYYDIVKARCFDKEELLGFLCHYLKVYYEDNKETDTRSVYHKFNVEIYVDKSPRLVSQYSLEKATKEAKWFNRELFKDIIKVAKKQQVEILKVESL